MRVAFLQDFFNNEIVGGAEQNDSVLINYLKKQEEFDIVPVHTYDFEKIKQFYDFYIISNFVNLSQNSKNFLIKNGNYLIYEHDHKYINTRDPSVFDRFQIPKKNIINYDFYKNAKKIFVLSNICKKIIENTLKIDNVENIGCSLWSEEELETIKNLSLNSEKKYKFSVLHSSNLIKGTREAIYYCETNNIRPQFIGNNDYEIFLKQLAESEHFIFLPQVLETFSRVTAEAKMLNCKVITTPKMIGFFSEDYSNLCGNILIENIKLKISQALPRFKSCILS